VRAPFCFSVRIHVQSANRPSVSFLLAITLATLSCGGGAPASDYPIRSIPPADVVFSDEFWAPRLLTNHGVTIPHDFRMNEETGRIANFYVAAGLRKGSYSGHHASADSDVFKTLDAAARSLVIFPEPALEARVDELAGVIAAAQEADGYLYTPRRIGVKGPRTKQVGPERWSYLIDSHELYNVGHFYEAAVQYFQATGKRNLLDIAIRSADFLCETFGPDKLRTIPGHQEVEIGLVKLYRVTGEKKYLDLAKFFLDGRGHHEDGREIFTYTDDPAQEQDHLPVIEQFEAKGHAVRAGYQYAAMVDVATLTEAPGYMEAIDRVWEDVVHRKMYLTGGIGSRLEGEAFGDAYELPNEVAKTETCAAIANALWQHRMFLRTGCSKYIDVLERVLYNGFLAAPSLRGDTFFYNNPLASSAESGPQKTIERKPWYGVPCCPTNIGRFFPTIPGLVYAQRAGDLYVNLFIGGQAEVQVDGVSVRLRQETDYPWDGRVKIVVELERPLDLTLRVRIPGWAAGRPAPGDLYRYLDAASEPVRLSLNGSVANATDEAGYRVISRKWQTGDTMELDLPMLARRVLGNEALRANQGLVALERGPVVYCVEGVDHMGAIEQLTLPDDVDVHPEFRADLLKGVVTLTAGDLTAVPYYAWANRGISPMSVWLPRR
jgi:uncharacterized protein